MDVTRRGLLGSAAALSAGLAGCVGGGSDGPPPAEDVYGDWLANAEGFEGVADETGSDRVTVAVGAKGGWAFEPIAVRVSPGTTVVWEWTGKGNDHNVVAESGAFESELAAREGYTYERAFEETGVVKYYCEPHRARGMKGGVHVVSDAESEAISP
jgi:halocyanin-like protein